MKAELNQQLEEVVKTQNGIVIAQTDEKISKVYEELTKNYEYTDSLIKERFSLLYDNLKDLSYVVHDNNSSLLSKFVDLERRIEEKVKCENEETKQAFNKIQNEMNVALFSISEETKKDIEIITDEITSKLDDMVFKFEDLKQQFNDEIHKKEKQFICILEEQEKRHNREISLLKEQMLEMEQRLYKDFETPCKKIYKYFVKGKQ